MKRCVLLFVLFSTISMSVKAQIRSDEACFYLEAGKRASSSETVWTVVCFKGNKAILEDQRTTLGRIKDNLKKDANYYENVDVQDGWNGWIYEYDPSLSTTSMVVYKRYHPGSSGGWFSYSGYYEYKAFSRDNTKLVSWREDNDKIVNKYQSIRVEKLEVMPKGVNREFLE